MCPVAVMWWAGGMLTQSVCCFMQLPFTWKQLASNCACISWILSIILQGEPGKPGPRGAAVSSTSPRIRSTISASNNEALTPNCTYVSLCHTNIIVFLGCWARWTPSKLFIYATQTLPQMILNITNRPLLTTINVPLNRDRLDLEDFRVKWEKVDCL